MIFVCFNTFENNKGIFVLLEASRILKENGKKFEVHFYGEGITATGEVSVLFITISIPVSKNILLYSSISFFIL